jgi:hypothetical protein
MEEKTYAPDEFTILIRAFNALVESEPPVDKIKADLEDIKKQADSSPELNHRQKDAIIDRIDHYLAGTYGKTKKREHLQLAPAQANGKHEK